MAEYIEREVAYALSKRICDEIKAGLRQPTLCQRILDFVDDIPAADVAPVRHGRWIIDRKFGNDMMSNEQMVICSECGKGIFWGKRPYCPNCGAKMDGEA